MAALTRRGLRVGAAKVGPDFIDPGYHALATGRPVRNLDAWICGSRSIVPLAARAGSGADLVVVEGTMGLFDGSADSPAGPTQVASTAHVARLLDAPVVLVVDASSLSASVAALVHGYATFDPAVKVAGVVLNRVGSDSHEALLRRALEPLGLPVLGALRRDDDYAWRDRHLGLVPVIEQRHQVQRSLRRLAGAIEHQCDLEALVGLAGTAPPLVAGPLAGARRSGRARVAVVRGDAFSFYYPDNLERLEEAGAELVPVDPVSDPALPPAVAALYAGGGFPEVFGEALAANTALLTDVRQRVRAGLVTWAECGGTLWLARSMDGRAMCGAVPAEARMTSRLSLGYRRARVLRDNPVAPAGSELRGHELHYSTVEPAGDALEMDGRSGAAPGGFASATLLASYLHLHLGADPAPAERLVAVASCPDGRPR